MMEKICVNLWIAKVAIRATFPHSKFLNLQIATYNNFLAYLAPSMVVADLPIVALI